jgi:hypothetical protein
VTRSPVRGLLDDTFVWHRDGIRDSAGRPGQDDHMARIPLATTVVVTDMVTVALAGSAGAAPRSAVSTNRGWVTSGSGSDDEPAGRH